MAFSNTYGDAAYADAYARLEFPGTYTLAFRDIPDLLDRHVTGRAGLDFGCGAGRSSRFLRSLGYRVVGVDISEAMLALARSADPGGDYRLVPDGSLAPLESQTFDVALAAFPFDNIPNEAKVGLFLELRRVLRPRGRFINIVSSPEIYHHEWLSFSTKAFPENRAARSGDEVRVINLVVDDRTPAVDIFCPPATYERLYAEAGLHLLEVHKPLGRPDEPHAWVNETKIAPWTISILAPGRV